jgi:hypothetical protein
MQRTCIKHAMLIVDQVRRMDRGELLAHLREWLGNARVVRRAVQTAERTVNARERNRAQKSASSLNELIREAAHRTARNDDDVERGVAAATEHLAMLRAESSVFHPHVVAGTAMWVAASAALPGRPKWPLANPEHLVVSAGMHAFGSKMFLPRYVAVLVLAELGHPHEAIARDLRLAADGAGIRRILRYAANT